jgi:hypothetical protein
MRDDTFVKIREQVNKAEIDRELIQLDEIEAIIKMVEEDGIRGTTFDCKVTHDVMYHGMDREVSVTLLHHSSGPYVSIVKKSYEYINDVCEPRTYVMYKNNYINGVFSDSEVRVRDIFNRLIELMEDHRGASISDISEGHFNYV